MKHSGLQRDVLSLYRKCLRVSRMKGEARVHFEKHARIEFEKAIAVDKKDFSAIEYLLRKGQRQIEMYSSPGIKDIRNSATTHSQQTKKQEETQKRPFRIHFLRRRVRDLRASSSVVRARRRASARAKHNIEVFGWDTPDAELASKVTTPEIEVRNRVVNRRSGSGANLRPAPRSNSGIPSTDGAANSVTRRSNTRKKSKKGYSLKYIAKVPVYWTADHPSARRASTFSPDRLYSAQRLGPLQAASNRILGPRPTEVRRRNDTGIDPLNPIAGQRRNSPSQPHFKPNTFQRATSQVLPARKDTGLSSLEFWEAVKDYSRQLKTKGTSASSVRSIVQSLVSETASRTPSQKKVLRRFTRGLELYLQAAKEHPSQSLISSPASDFSTSVSAFTLHELKPYRSEFQSADLAVTSAEQKGMANLREDSPPPPTPPKDQSYGKSRSLPRKKSTDTRKPTEKRKEPSYASGSTGTTVLGWTPPHEKSYGRPPMVESRSSSASTEHTIIGFTPLHHMSASLSKPVREAPAPPQATTKKSLPWIRKAGPSPEASLTQKRSVISVKPEQQHRTSTPLTGWVSTVDVPEPLQSIERNLEPEDNIRLGLPKGPTEKKREDFRYGTAKSTADNFISKMVTEMATRTGPSISIPLENLELIRPKVEYSNLATQTVELSPVVPRRPTEHDDYSEHSSEINRAPIPSGRSKTFPSRANKCKGNCEQPPKNPHLLISQGRLSRPSKVTWMGGADQEIQTVQMPVDSIDNIERADNQKTQNALDLPSFQSKAVPGERTRTFPFANSPTKRIGPYQPPQISGSLIKGADEGKSTWIQIDREQEEEILNQSPRRALASSPQLSAPPLCVQCAGPLNPTPKPEPELEPTPEPSEQPPAHACTARSSTQCQQCFPSRDSSIAISPRQVTSPAEMRGPVEIQYLPTRRFTRPLIHTGPVNYPEAEPGLANTQNSYHSPERTRPQSKVEQLVEEYLKSEPMADPMKRPPLPRIIPKPNIPDPPKHVHCYSTFSRPKTFPLTPKVPEIHTVALPAFASTISTDSCSLRSAGFDDKQVFKGLHVATAAACDEDVDKWIEEITGSSARKFLSALSAFNGLGSNTLAGVARRAAKQRRQKINAWETTRNMRVAEKARRPRCEDGEFVELEYVMGDQGVEMGYEYAKTSSEVQNYDDEYNLHDQGVKTERDGLTKSMFKGRAGKGSEGARE
ncbi:uncharacterized protein RAG0_04382 [Rhynchosporium agropyri]|uniref:Complex 1 LYR protein domain-containing protein n=1 Tax=Rhynchosporium agropyri TaxID=914238 RepID=A0A1E1K8X3_9HELO|nr:uncharacterized protein RAG0_04382 [Rhynchosporium agropyri]